MTVLIADDNADLGALLAGILRSDGFAVDVCQDADVAIASMAGVDYSAILVEPAAEAGFRPLMEYLETHRSDGLDGVVVATTDNDEDVQREWTGRGVFRFLRKPLTPARLREAIQACADHHDIVRNR